MKIDVPKTGVFTKENARNSYETANFRNFKFKLDLNASSRTLRRPRRTRGWG